MAFSISSIKVVYPINLFPDLKTLVAPIFPDPIFLISKYSSLASLVGSLSIPIYLLIFNESQLLFFAIMFVLIFYTHRENIKRLKNKEESKSKIY